MKRVFVCSAYRGDVAANVETARAACREVLRAGNAPFAPHLLYPDLLDDDVAEERALGIAAGRAWLAASHEILVVGAITDGMREEIAAAQALGIPVRYAATPPAPPSPWQRIAAWIESQLPGAWHDRVVLAAIAFVVVAFLFCPGR